MINIKKEKEDCDYGCVEWKSVYVLTFYLLHNELLLLEEKIVVVEVSAGMCFLSRQLIQLLENRIRVIATDLPHLQQQLLLRVEDSTKGDAGEAEVLRFGNEEDIQNLQQKLLRSHSNGRIIFAVSDVLYEDELIHKFFYTLSLLLSTTYTTTTTTTTSSCCFLAYECRSLKKIDLILAWVEYYDLVLEKIEYDCEEVVEYYSNRGIINEDFGDVELYRVRVKGC